MRGSTRKRGKSWTAYWDVQRVSVANGTLERVQRSKGGFRTQKAAQAHLNEQLTNLSAGTYAEPSTAALGSFLINKWLPAIRGEVRPNTFETYATMVRRYVGPRDIGGVPLRTLTAGHFNGLYADLERCSDPNCGHGSVCKGLSVASRRLVHSVLRRSLNDAVKWGDLRRNPITGANPPKQSQTRVQSWTATELRRFLGHVADDRLFALWRLAATTGMRRGELLGLAWQTVDLDHGRLRVEQQLVVARGGCAFGPPKSRRSSRSVALDAETVDVLRRHRDVQLLERDIAADVYDDHDLVFCDELGRPIQPQRLTDRFDRLRKAAQIPVGHLHMLRHTAATLALEARVPLHVVAARLGDDPKTVLSTYAHLLPDSDAAAADAVAAAIVDKPLTETTVTPVQTR